MGQQKLEKGSKKIIEGKSKKILPQHSQKRVCCLETSYDMANPVEAHIRNIQNICSRAILCLGCLPFGPARFAVCLPQKEMGRNCIAGYTHYWTDGNLRDAVRRTQVYGAFYMVCRNHGCIWVGKFGWFVVQQKAKPPVFRN